MTILSGLGIVLSLVFGGLLLALAAELYYLLWYKKQRINHNNRVEEEESNYSNHTKELFYLFCWDKPTSVNPTNSSTPSSITPNPETQFHDPDVELGLASRSKDLLLMALGDDAVDSDILGLVGPPRFLFTIKEETKEDLESDDGKSRADRKGSRTRSLSDLIMALETQTPYLSPNLASSPRLDYNNPLFESSLEAEINRLRSSSSPPPKFKFLRDAEEKLYKKLVQEAQKSYSTTTTITTPEVFPAVAGCGEIRVTKSKVGNVGGGRNKDREVHCSSQVLPLASSPPTDCLSENKPSLHH